MADNNNNPPTEEELARQREYNEEIERGNKLWTERKQLFEDSLRNRTDSLKIAQTEASDEIQRLEMVKERYRFINDIVETFKIEQEHDARRLDQEQKMANARLEELDIRERALLNEERKLVAEGHSAEIAREILQSEHDQLTVLQSELEVEYDILATKKEQITATQKTNEITQDWLQSVTGVSERWKDTLAGSIILTKDIKKSMHAMAAGFMELMSPANVMGTVLMAVKEESIALMKAFDETTVAVDRATSQFGKFDNQVMESFQSQRHMIIGMESVRDATIDLSKNMKDFNDLNKEQQTELVNFTSMMDKLGVATGESGELFDDFTKSLGLGVTRSKQIYKELLGTAKAIKMPFDEMIKGMKAAMPVLAAYGSRAPQIFKRVAAAARATGVETQRLLSIFSQFDTFEDAADKVGKLNAILGGSYLNSVEMMAADEEERIRLMLQGIEASGKSWESMGKFERKAIAAAAGIQDMNEANKLFGKGLVGYDQMLAKSEANAAGQKELEDASRSLTTMTEKLKEVWTLFAVSLAPVLDLLHGFFDAIFEINKATGGYFIPLMIGLVGVWWAFNAVMGFVLARKKLALIAQLAENAASATAMGQNTVLIGQEATLTAEKMAEAGASTTLAGAEKGVVMGKGAEVKANTALIAQGPAVTGSITAQSGAIGVLGAVAALSAVQIIALGAGIALAAIGIGTGIALAAWGIGVMAEGMKGLGWEALALSINVAILAGTFYFLVPALTAAATALAGLAAAGTPAAPILLAIGATALMIGSAIALAALGVGEMSRGLAEMGPNAWQAAIVVGALAGSMALMAFVSAKLSIGLGALAIGLTAMLIPIFGVGAAIKWISPELESLGKIFTGLGTASTNLSTGTKTAFDTILDIGDKGFAIASSITLIIGAITRLGGAIEKLPSSTTLEVLAKMEDIPEAKMAALTGVFTGFENMPSAAMVEAGLALEKTAQAAETIRPEVVENTKGLVDQAVRYTEFIQENKVAAAENPAF